MATTPTEVLIARLARAGLSDADYLDTVATLRQLDTIAGRGEELAAAVLAAASYQPTSVLNALSAFDAATVQSAAA